MNKRHVPSLLLLLPLTVVAFMSTTDAFSSSSSSPTGVDSIHSLQPDRLHNKTTTNDSMTTTSEDEEDGVVRSLSYSPQKLNETTMALPIAEARNQILRLIVLTGELSGHFMESMPLDTTAAQVQPVSTKTAEAMRRMLACLLDLASILSMDLETAIETKMMLNACKYPAHLCKGRAGKYTDYTEHTGISKEHGQSTLHLQREGDNKQSGSNDKSFVEVLPNLTMAIREFAHERQWTRFHLPRNLLLALTGELGELAELFQFLGDNADQSLTRAQWDKVRQEMADVTIYLIRLADVCGVSLVAATRVE